jgi:hypothetical protein
VNQIASSPLASRSLAMLDCAVVMPDIFDAVPCISSLMPGCEVNAYLEGI